MKRMLLLGIVTVSLPALSCAPAWADQASSGAVHATNAAMTVNRSTDYSAGRRWMSTNFNRGLGFRQPAVICHAQSTFGTDMSRTDKSGMATPRTMEIVYVARVGSTCGMAPFYGFSFINPVDP